MGRINIYSTSGSNKASLEYDGASDVTVDTAHLTGTSSNLQTQLNAKASTADVQNVITKSATAPSSPSNGDFWYDTDTTSFYFYDGSDWQLIKQSFAATGGSVTESQGYRIHTFTSSGTFTVTKGQAEVEYVVVGGGGAGGADDGGGGGAGGYRSSVNGEPSGGGSAAENKLLVTLGSYTVTIGAGAPGNDHQAGRSVSSGNSTTFGTITSLGGGMGGNSYSAAEHQGLPGGSGGGNHQGRNVTTNGGSGTSGQGYHGGSGDAGTDVFAGGGGGASEPGNTNSRSYGGDGVQSAITGTNVYYAGGGGGCDRSASSAIPGGNGGGGNGSHQTTANTGSAGSANTGGGGGGGPGTGTNYERRGHAGGSGIVIIRYPI